jgi:hypothetical protein
VPQGDGVVIYRMLSNPRVPKIMLKGSRCSTSERPITAVEEGILFVDCSKKQCLLLPRYRSVHVHYSVLSSNNKQASSPCSRRLCQAKYIQNWKYFSK